MNNSASNSEFETANAPGGDIPADVHSAASAIMDRVVGDLRVARTDCYEVTDGMESLALESYALMCADWDNPWHGTVWVQATSMRSDMALGQGAELVLNGPLGGSYACLEKLAELSTASAPSPSLNGGEVESESLAA